MNKHLCSVVRLLPCVCTLVLAVLLLSVSAALPAADAPVPPDAAAQSAPARGPDAAARRDESQPFNNAPVWRDVRSGDINQNQRTQVRGRETNVLVQTDGEIWRRIRNGPITVFGGTLMIFAIVVLLAFYLWKGPLKVHGPLTGRKILRLTPWDRTIHWTVALTWVTLAVSGIILLFGKYIVLPLFGYTLFSVFAIVSKNLHNFVGPVFLIAAALMFFTYLGRNIPCAHDIGWLMKGGGMLTGEHVPSGFFNAGEKIVFWLGLFLFSIIVSASGLVLLFPNLDQSREVMQYANIIHGVTAMFYMAMIFGHMYLGTIGMEGAYHTMRYDGLVDEQWAKEHHEYWYDEVMARRGGAPAANVPAAPPPGVVRAAEALDTVAHR
jgi:formate dehydrogenase subunit gamma